MKTPRFLVPLATLAIVTLSPSPAQAVDRYWVATEEGAWNVTTNWNTAEDGSGSSGRPSAADLDRVYITNGGEVLLSGSQGSILALGLGSTDGLVAGSLTIQSGGTLRINTSGATIRAGSTLTVEGTLNVVNGSIFNVSSSLGAGYLTVNSGGTFNHQGAGGDSSQLRLGVGGGRGEVTVDGGAITLVNNLTIGRSNDATGILTLKNGGTYTTSPGSQIIFGATGAATQYTGVTATLNIGGETTAEAAGTLSGVYRLAGFNSANTNTLNFNHTATRHEFKDQETGQNIELRAAIAVDIRSGVTVLGTADSNYTRDTIVYSGGTLLANHTANNEFSSTGNSAGAVTVQEGGTLGGLGYVAGNTTIEGTLKPGDYAYGATISSHGNLRFRDNVTLTDTAVSEFLLGADTTRGSTYSSITTAGSLVLDGTLSLTLDDGLTLDQGDTLTYQLFTATGGISGAFDSYLLPEFWNDIELSWDLAQLPTSGLVTLHAIPEPSTLLLLAGALPLLGALRLRRQRR